MNPLLLIPRPGLHPLPELASTDLHFVADDWSGSGNWTSRDSNHWIATTHGAVVQQNTSQFTGRKEVTGFITNSAYFSLAANIAHALNSDITVEAIIVVDDSTGAQVQYYGNEGAAGCLQLTTYPPDHHFYIEPFDSDGTRHEIAGPVITSYANKYVLITITISQGTNACKVYINGVVNSTSGTLGTYASDASLPLYLGATTLSTGYGKPIVEIMRHTSILSASQIAARAAQFNLLKGY